MCRLSFQVFWIAFLCAWSPFQLGAQDSVKKTVDPSGTWRWEYELEGTQYKDLVRLKLGEDIKDSKDKVVQGKYESTSGKKIAIENGRLSGDTIRFEFKVNFQGMDVKLEFEGTIKNDTLTGKVNASTAEGSRDLDWSATRSVLPEDVVGKWKLRIDANGNIMEPILTVSRDGDKLKASYALGNDVQIQAKEIKIEKNVLSFTIETDFEGSKIKADFMGRPYGDKLKGSIDYVLGGDVGEVDFSGQKQEESV